MCSFETSIRLQITDFILCDANEEFRKYHWIMIDVIEDKNNCYSFPGLYSSLDGEISDSFDIK